MNRHSDKNISCKHVSWKSVSWKRKLLPFILTLGIIAADQGVKSFIVHTWPLEGKPVRMITDVFGNNLLWLIHVRNKAIAFSLGHNLPEFLRPPLFIAVPVLLLGCLVWYSWTGKDLTSFQRWTLAGILGGGLGNIIDRICRPDGVVDFISVNFFGLFGLARFPTFNIADSAVVISCGLLIGSILFGPGARSANPPAPDPDPVPDAAH